MVNVVILKYCVKGQENSDRFYTALQTLEDVNVRIVSPVEYQANKDDINDLLSDSSQFSLLLITSERSLHQVNPAVLKAHWSKMPVFCMGLKTSNQMKSILGFGAKVEHFLRAADLSRLVSMLNCQKPILILCGCTVPSTIAKVLDTLGKHYESVATYSSSQSSSILADSYKDCPFVNYIVVFNPFDAQHLLAEMKDSSLPNLEKLRFLTVSTVTTKVLCEGGISSRRIFQSCDPTPEALTDTLLSAMQTTDETSSEEQAT